MEELKHVQAKSLDSQPLGVLYFSNQEYSNVPNFNLNQYYPRVVDEALDQVSINTFYIVPIPIEIDINNPLSESSLAYLKATLEQYDYITYFVCPFPTTYIDAIFEAYFRYNHSKILSTTNSSQIGANYADNVIRFLPNDYPTVNFWTNIYLKNSNAFDIVFLNGEFINTNDTLGYDAVKSDLVIISEFLSSIGKTMEPNPYDPSAAITGLPSITTDPAIGPQFDNPDGVTGDDVFTSIYNTLDSTQNPDYYTKNYYSSIKIQMAQNPIDPETYPDYLKVMLEQFLKDYPYPETINWQAIVTYVENINITNGELTYDVNPDKLGYLPYLLYYLSFFDYTKQKDIFLVLTQYQFPAILAAINYYIPLLADAFGIPNLVENVQTKVRFLLSNVNNIDEFNYQLFTDPRTDQIWQYDTGMTWYDILQAYTVRTIIPRGEQSSFALFDKMSQTLNLTINGQYYDFGKTNQPLIYALYNSLSFMYHFVKNDVKVSDFILNYFLTTKLLNFGNNLIFDQYMDNIYDVSVDTTFFYGGSTIVNRSLTNRKVKSVSSKNLVYDVFSTIATDNKFVSGAVSDIIQNWIDQNMGILCYYKDQTVDIGNGVSVIVRETNCEILAQYGAAVLTGNAICRNDYFNGFPLNLLNIYCSLGYIN